MINYNSLQKLNIKLMKRFAFLVASAAFTCLSIIGCSQKNNDDQRSTEPGTTVTEIGNTSFAQPAVNNSGFDVSGKDTLTTDSGLKYIIISVGEGTKPAIGKSVAVHYTGYLTDGTKFDSSVDRGEPIQFPLGTGKVIRGWDEGIALMNVGSKARLIIPHELGYGTEGYPPIIPANATLIFDVELVAAD
jgi:peptidylprolyl isomerase